MVLLLIRPLSAFSKPGNLELLVYIHSQTFGNRSEMPKLQSFQAISSSFFVSKRKGHSYDETLPTLTHISQRKTREKAEPNENRYVYSESRYLNHN